MLFLLFCCCLLVCLFRRRVSLRFACVLPALCNDATMPCFRSSFLSFRSDGQNWRFQSRHLAILQSRLCRAQSGAGCSRLMGPRERSVVAVAEGRKKSVLATHQRRTPSFRFESSPPPQTEPHEHGCRRAGISKHLLLLVRTTTSPLGRRKVHLHIVTNDLSQHPRRVSVRVGS